MYALVQSQCSGILPYSIRMNPNLNPSNIVNLVSVAKPSCGKHGQNRAPSEVHALQAVAQMPSIEDGNQAS